MTLSSGLFGSVETPDAAFANHGNDVGRRYVVGLEIDQRRIDDHVSRLEYTVSVATAGKVMSPLNVTRAALPRDAARALVRATTAAMRGAAVMSSRSFR